MAKYAFNILAGVNVAGMKKGFSDGVSLAKGFGDSLVKNFALVAKGTIPLSSGVKNVGNSFKALAANPVGLALIAIVGTLKLLHSALGKSAEGQRILAAGSAVLSGIMQTLTNLTTDLAGFFIKLFKDPKTAMSDFGKSLKTAVMAPINSMLSGVKFLGKALSKLFKGDIDGAWEAAKDGAKEFGKAIGSANPLLIIGKKLTQNISDNMKDSVSLAQREHDLYEKTTKWLSKKAEYERIIAEERRKLTERGQTVEEQQASEVRLSQAIAKLYAGNNELMTEQANILKEKNALGENTKEDNRAEAELQVQITNNLTAQEKQLKKNAELFRTTKIYAQQYSDEITEQNRLLKAQGAILPKLEAKGASVEATDTKAYDDAIKASANKSIAETQRKAAAAKAAATEQTKNAKTAAEAEKDARIEFGTQMFSELGSLEQTLYDRKSQLIDDQAAREIEAVTNSSLSEEEKAAKIANIQTKADLDKRKIDIKAAKAEKRNALIAIAINTAVAVSKAAMQTGVFVWAAAAPLIALGAAQAATVAAQPIPKLADGGIAYGNSIVNVGEYAGAKSNPEVIAPLDKLKNLIGNNDSGGRIISIQIEGREIARAYEDFQYKKNR